MDDFAPLRFHRASGVGTDPIPVSRYTSHAYFEQEKERIFRRKWLNVGRVTRIPNRGDYFVKDLRVANTSLLIIHGNDGKFRAFHNMCSHRANPVSWDDDGKCAGKNGYIQCRFHGWVYDFTGKLVHVSDAANFPSVEKDKNGLTPVHCDVWEGFIFVNLAENPDQSLSEYLNPIVSEITGYPFADFVPSFSYRIDERVNWKTLQEAQLEGWHLPYLHDKTLALAVGRDGLQFRHAALDLLGPHGVIGAPPPKSYNPSPVGQIVGRYGTDTAAAFAKQQGAGGPAGPKWRGSFDFYFVFPNTFIGLLQGTYFTFNIWPIAVDHSIWEINGYYPKVATAGQLFAREYSKIGLRDPMMEDCYTHEKINGVIASGAKSHIHFQDEELLCRHMSDTADRCVRGLE
jgi:phenylpropionate dioxygenase-like ring-hydroxylating dioxygenase large terminal subunit